MLGDLVDNILTGLCKCSHTKFKKTFEDVRSLRGQTLLRVLDITGSTLERIEKIFELETAKYNKFCLDETWRVPGGGKHKHAFSCWNCGDDLHRVPECPKPKDKARINQAKKEFQEKKWKGGDMVPNTSRNDYLRRKFGRPGPKDNGVKKINNVALLLWEV